MMLEILIVFLITLVYSKDANLTVFHVKDWNKNEAIKGKQGLICYELHKDIKANDKFYLHMYCDEDNKAINKQKINQRRIKRNIKSTNRGTINIQNAIFFNGGLYDKER